MPRTESHSQADIRRYRVELIHPLRHEAGMEETTLLIDAKDWRENARYVWYLHYRIPLSNIRQIGEYYTSDDESEDHEGND